MTFVPATYWDGGDVSDTLDVAGLTKGQMMPEKRRFPVVMQTLTATNDPSRSPQSSEVTQQVETLTRAGAGVRRLTPTECERLQGLEDGWTLPGPDSRRYAGLGDAVTANVAHWIGNRLKEYA